MHRLHIGVAGMMLASLLIAPLVFADDDRGRSKSEDKRKDDDKKSYVLPFSSIGTSTSALMEQIKSLQAMIEQLKNQRKALEDSTRDQKKDLNNRIDDNQDALKDAYKQLKFERSLYRGLSGDDVRDLQELLAADPEIFSSANITGFFGPLTEAAVRKFQRKHSIEVVGIFGPKTQAKLLAIFADRELPPGIAKRLGLAFGTSTPGTGFVTVCHKPAGTNPANLVIAVPALGAHLGHGDTVGFCNSSGTGTTTDTTAPTISNAGISNLTATGITIGWTTNELAAGKIYYSTTTPVNLAAASTTGTTSYAMNHSLNLTNLTPSTTYYFVIESKDTAGNTATTSSIQFTTQAATDTTAPQLFNVGISSLASTSVTFIWTTNEPATGKVYYSTTTPMNLATALSTGTTTLSTAHSLTLTGLATSTTYRYVLESKDGANNTATTTPLLFTTGN